MVAIERIRKASSAQGYREQIAGLVRERKSHSERYFDQVRKRIPYLYNIYRGYTLGSGRHQSHKNNIHIPLIFSTIQSDVARKTQTSFGSWPIVSFVGNSPEDAIIARKREALVSTQMKDAGSFRKGYDLFLTSDLYGTTFLQYGWRHDIQPTVITHTDFLPVSGKQVTYDEKRSIVTFDGPDWRVLDILDSFPQPGVPLSEDWDWFITREYLDIDKIVEYSETMIGGKPVFDPNEVNRLIQEGGNTGSVFDQYKELRGISRNEMDAEAKLREFYARPVEIWTYWGRIPSELVPVDGATSRRIVIANETYVLANRANPFWNQKIPIIVNSPTPDPHTIYAPGKAEIAYKLQIVANQYTNKQLDAMDLFIDPVFLFNAENELTDTENLFIRPGKWIGTQGLPSEQVTPLIPNLNGVQMGGQMTEILWRWMQQGLGIIEDTVMGGGQGGRQTAREFLGRSEAVATRLLLESRLFEESCLEPLADAFVDLNRQFLTTPREVFILGRGALIDEVTGLRIPQRTRATVDGWDLVPNYEARAVGATTRMGAGMRQQALTFLIQAMSQNPMAATAVNWTVFLRDIFKAFEIDNIDEIINSPSEQEKMMMLVNRGERNPNEVPGTPKQVGNAGGLPNYAGQGVM